jgi:glucose/arabinose dehydrogenase
MARPTGRPEATELLNGLTSPWGLIALKDGTFLISERDTKQILRAEGSETDTVRTIEDAQPFGEGGLLGLAITPDERRVFAYYTAADDNRIVAMSWDGRSLGEPELILDGIPKAGVHDGGRIIVGPDGHLYVATGDSGESQEAQDKSSLGGKILRVTVDGEPAPGNPFGDEVFSFGHRNVQGLAFDEEGRLWASEFGSQSWDELNLIEKGRNYGWPLVEGSGEGRGLTNPKVVWRTSEASPSGLAYWQGNLWMAGLRGERLWQIPVEGTDTGDPQAHFEDEYGRLRTVVVSSDGQSLLLTGSNTDGRGDPREGDDRLWQIRLV